MAEREIGKNLIESLMGAVVLAVAGLFLAFAWTSADLDSIEGYPLSASFTSVGGLARGSDVRINGIKVGTVVDQSLDPVTYAAVVHMNIRPGVRLPSDTVAAVASEGLLGGKYIQLNPGHGGDVLPPGGRLTHTRDYKSMEELVAEIIFLATGGPGQTGGAGGPVPDPLGLTDPLAPSIPAVPLPQSGTAVPAAPPALPDLSPAASTGPQPLPPRISPRP